MSGSKLVDLIALAKEDSSPRRRELLREVTDLFFTHQQPATEPEMQLFDSVLTQLSSEMEEQVRADLGLRFADAERAPRGLIRRLANDTLAVAEPILTRSTALTEEDLLEVVRKHGQGHLQAVSRRDHVSERVSDVIVERGDDQTLGVLLRNDGAELSRQASETVVDRAASNPDLQEAAINRGTLPPDLLNELYFVAEARLRQRILDENAKLDPAALEKALANGRRTVAAKDGALPADYDAAEAYIRELRDAGELTPRVLARFLRSGGMTQFLVALAQLADIDFHTARHIVERQELDALAIVCKAADLDRALFLTYAVVLLSKEADAMGRAQEYGKLYGDLPKETALRTIRFWRVRRQSTDLAA
ncbi:DUF2336 domain-containing protein [Caulobacter sp. 17J65-9]|uniref:DUF2336 domain-containing protein n=1 Tax=Caulobacter sp. 17J65-9 TaxID=2709382 RepID=UPI0013C7C3E2|nr:DUF2336 domain-containing protein [Caulobacter sp. 17J65-9]NEX93866.1 DUF2336 domain-containing protein [Caulobacter sp. 17J65-9]